MNDGTLAICGTVLGALLVHPQAATPRRWLLGFTKSMNDFCVPIPFAIAGAICADLIIPLKIYETIIVAININGPKRKRPPLLVNFNTFSFFHLTTTRDSAMGGRLNEEGNFVPITH